MRAIFLLHQRGANSSRNHLISQLTDVCPISCFADLTSLVQPPFGFSEGLPVYETIQLGEFLT
jgi:hypothetical protein